MKKIFGKLKQLSKDIKLIIITTLIMSCIGVYAVGVCIVGATSDDVTYNNGTVTEALNELYSLAENHCPDGYECTVKKYSIDCSDNRQYTTIPSGVTGLARKMASEAYLDNASSEYVTSCNGVSFAAISSDTNGKGVYEIASTKDDDYPIYYYRGAVDNNNVLFGGFCWKAIRTTDTGGVKMIYNGEPDGSGRCTNTTGESTQLDKMYFGDNSSIPAYIGYTYGTIYKYITYNNTDNRDYLFGNDVTYSNGTYTLVDTKTVNGVVAATDINNYHYTCWNTSNSCSSVKYVTMIEGDYIFTMTLNDGEKIEDVLQNLYRAPSVLNNDSIPKSYIENFYADELNSNSAYIEDTIYCNDRSIGALNGWNPNGGDASKSLYFSPRNRVFSTHQPSLECSSNYDKYTVSSTKGNGALEYPIGLITADEAMYAGGIGDGDNTSYYLYSNESYWTMSPRNSRDSVSGLFGVDSNGRLEYFNTYVVDESQNSAQIAIRPVISINSNNTKVSSGDGTSNTPYVVIGIN